MASNKYRVIQNGDYWVVQQKTFFGWRGVGAEARNESDAQDVLEMLEKNDSN